ACTYALGPLLRLVMLRPSLRPPLFPYTTLFRSISWASTRLHEPKRWLSKAQLVNTHSKLLWHRLKVDDLFGRLVSGPKRSSTLRDRKSTRLNSSHVSISYAVFCLKNNRVPHTM